MNKIRVSMLMPSRMRSKIWEKNLTELYSLSNQPDTVEVVTALDEDDQEREEYISISNKFPNQQVLIGNKEKTGYSKCGMLWEKCAGASKGDVMSLWNDDMFIKTKGWDDVLHESLYQKMAVGTGQIVGDAYRFCCVSVSRLIYDAIGGFTFNHIGSIDRCYEALCKYHECEVRVPITVHHFHNIDFPERDAFYKYCSDNWDAKLIEWDKLGLEAANKIKEELKNYEIIT